MIAETLSSSQPTEGPRGPESSSKPVFEAFKKGFQYYEKSILALQGKAEKDPASLSKDEKGRLSDFEVCKKGSQKAGEDGKLIPVETAAGISHEGIPVEGMIEVLNEQILKIYFKMARHDANIIPPTPLLSIKITGLPLLNDDSEKAHTYSTRVLPR